MAESSNESVRFVARSLRSVTLFAKTPPNTIVINHNRIGLLSSFSDNLSSHRFKYVPPFGSISSPGIRTARYCLQITLIPSIPLFNSSLTFSYAPVFRNYSRCYRLLEVSIPSVQSGTYGSLDVIFKARPASVNSTQLGLEIFPKQCNVFCNWV